MLLTAEPRDTVTILVDMSNIMPESHCDDLSVLGRRVRELREKRGVSQRKLAFPGCSAAYISRLEAGNRRPSIQLLHRLAWRLYTPTSYLAQGMGNPSSPPTDAITALAGNNRSKQRHMTALAVEMRLSLVQAGRL